MSPTPTPSLGFLRDRLKDTSLPANPTAVVMPPGSETWPRDVQASLTASLRPAGVLIPVIERTNGLVVLLTRRSAALKHHASQVAFPGGGMEDGDGDIAATALRETYEEVGIRPEQISVLGYLDAMPTITGYAVTPVVGSVEPSATIVVDRSEVEITFEVPLDFLLDAANARATVREISGRQLPVVEYRYQQHRIWGATAHMLINLMEKLR